MLSMVERKNTQPKPPKRKPANRKGKPLHVFIREDIDAALMRAVKQSRPHATRRAHVEAALEDYLQKLGLWTPPPAQAGDN